MQPPTLVMHSLPSPFHSPKPPRSNKQTRARSRTACLRWASEMAAEVDHKGKRCSPVFPPPFLLSSKKDCNSNLHPPRSSWITPSIPLRPWTGKTRRRKSYGRKLSPTAVSLEHTEPGIARGRARRTCTRFSYRG